jgi:hypothetical protein
MPDAGIQMLDVRFRFQDVYGMMVIDEREPRGGSTMLPTLTGYSHYISLILNNFGILICDISTKVPYPDREGIVVISIFRFSR